MEPRLFDKTSRGIQRVSAMLVWLSLGGCMTAVPPDHSLAPEKLAQLRAICVDTMKYSPGDTRFIGCVDTLSQSAQLAGMPRSTGDSSSDQERQRATASCMQAGLPSGSWQVNDCVTKMQTSTVLRGTD
jgi:hypothetical protein